MGKGCAQGFVEGYHKGWSDAHLWYQAARRDGEHQMPGKIGETPQHPDLFQGSIQLQVKRETPHNCNQAVQSEVQAELTSDDLNVEVKSELQSEL